jgi:DNA-binding response OmpR family regulator
LIDEKARILVMEDDPMDFGFVRKAFDNLSSKVELFHCQDASNLFAMIDEKACRILFLDLSLSGQSGLELLQMLRAEERYQAMPVIVFSSSGSRRDIQACYAAGANAYLEKPLTMDMYRKFAQHFSDFWLDVAKLP